MTALYLITVGSGIWIFPPFARTCDHDEVGSTRDAGRFGRTSYDREHRPGVSTDSGQ
jgi:hypothetical protein